jgi:hypothetical protein
MENIGEARNFCALAGLNFAKVKKAQGAVMRGDDFSKLRNLP